MPPVIGNKTTAPYKGETAGRRARVPRPVASGRSRASPALHTHSARITIKAMSTIPLRLSDRLLAKMHPGGTVFTLDAHFRIYRRHGNKVRPLLRPEG